MGAAVEREWGRRQKRDDARVVEELRSVGLEVSSVFDLVNTSERLPRAIPILVRLLSEPMETNVKEGIVRALTV